MICLFSYAGTDEHALVVVVDYNASGMLRDGWVTSQVATLLERGQELGNPERGPAGNGGADAGFRKVSSPGARKLLESALLVTERAEDPPVSDSFPSYHAFVRARIRTLPPTSTKVTALSAGRAGRPPHHLAVRPAGHAGSGVPGF